MKFEIKSKNNNYLATIVEIKNIISLENCANVQSTIIFGNSVIISKDIKKGDIGIFFPVECSISDDFLSANNLFREKELNVDKTKAGFFEKAGRVKCLKFRGHKSEGFWLPINCIEKFGLDKININENIGTEFDHINGIKICEKYIVKQNNIPGMGGKQNKLNKRLKKFDRLIDGVFKFHISTPHLGKEIFRLKPNDIISITGKLDGTSGISSYILCKRKLNIIEKFLKLIGIKIQETEYDYIYSSRTCIKNNYLYDKEQKHYYNEDLWESATKELKDYLQKDMIIYYEIVGFTTNGKPIQKRNGITFDYGCDIGKHKIFIYRITTNNVEWSMLQIKQWCFKNGLNVVPELYYGYAKDFINELYEDDNKFRELFIKKIEKEYLEIDEPLCKNKGVPREGVVVRIEDLDINVMKHKSFKFKELETRSKDKGEIDIEENQE